MTHFESFLDKEVPRRRHLESWLGHHAGDYAAKNTEDLFREVSRDFMGYHRTPTLAFRLACKEAGYRADFNPSWGLYYLRRCDGC